MKLSIIGWIERVMVQNGTAELLQGKEIGTVLFSAQAKKIVTAFLKNR